MPIKNEKIFIPIALGIFKKLKLGLLFDVFVKINETKYTKIFKHGDMLDWERAKKYSSRGIESFFVRIDEYEKYIQYVSKMSSKYLGDKLDLPAPEKMAILKELINVTCYDLIYKTNIDEQTIQNSGQAVESCISELAESPKTLIKIIRSMSDYPHIFKHSIGTSIFALILAKADNIESSQNLKIIGMGAFLHDVGHSQLSFDTETVEHLSPEQWQEMKSHTETGKRLLDTQKGIRSEVLNIIMQHHEQINGRGYPNGLAANEIYPPAKIVAIADAFSSLTSQRPWRDAQKPSKALEIMASDVGKYDPRLLELFTSTLGLSS